MDTALERIVERQHTVANLLRKDPSSSKLFRIFSGRLQQKTESFRRVLRHHRSQGTFLQRDNSSADLDTLRLLGSSSVPQFQDGDNLDGFVDEVVEEEGGVEGEEENSTELASRELPSDSPKARRLVPSQSAKAVRAVGKKAEEDAKEDEEQPPPLTPAQSRRARFRWHVATKAVIFYCAVRNIRSQREVAADCVQNFLRSVKKSFAAIVRKFQRQVMRAQHLIKGHRKCSAARVLALARCYTALYTDQYSSWLKHGLMAPSEDFLARSIPKLEWKALIGTADPPQSKALEYVRSRYTIYPRRGLNAPRELTKSYQLRYEAMKSLSPEFNMPEWFINKVDAEFDLLYLDFIDGLKPYRLLARDKETQKELILAYMPPKMPTAKLQLLLRRVLALFRKAHSSDYRRVDTDLKKLEAATRDASFDTDDMRVLLAMSPGETDRVLTEFYLGNALSRRTKLSPLQLYSHPWLKETMRLLVLRWCQALCACWGCLRDESPIFREGECPFCRTTITHVLAKLPRDKRPGSAGSSDMTSEEEEDEEHHKDTKVRKTPIKRSSNQRPSVSSRQKTHRTEGSGATARSRLRSHSPVSGDEAVSVPPQTARSPRLTLDLDTPQRGSPSWALRRSTHQSRPHTSPGKRRMSRRRKPSKSPSPEPLAGDPHAINAGFARKMAELERKCGAAWGKYPSTTRTLVRLQPLSRSPIMPTTARRGDHARSLPRLDSHAVSSEVDPVTISQAALQYRKHKRQGKHTFGVPPVSPETSPRRRHSETASPQHLRLTPKQLKGVNLRTRKVIQSLGRAVSFPIDG